MDEMVWASHEAMFAFRNNEIMADFKSGESYADTRAFVH